MVPSSFDADTVRPSSTAMVCAVMRTRSPSRCTAPADDPGGAEAAAELDRLALVDHPALRAEPALRCTSKICSRENGAQAAHLGEVGGKRFGHALPHPLVGRDCR